MPVKEQVLDEIRRMSVADLVDLVRATAAELGTSGNDVRATAASVPEPAEGSGASDLSISLSDFGADKIEVIRAVREITDLGWREAQALVDASPSQVANWDPDADSDTSTDADGPESAGTPARPKTPVSIRGGRRADGSSGTAAAGGVMGVEASVLGPVGG